MKKKMYQQPEMKVVEFASTAILAGSGNTERLGDGGDIFGGGASSKARGGSIDDEEDF